MITSFKPTGGMFTASAFDRFIAQISLSFQSTVADIVISIIATTYNLSSVATFNLGRQPQS